jgi:hypothetical protein
MPSNTYVPAELEVLLTATPVAGFVSVTWAPWTRAPLLSFTVPVTRDVDCAHAITATNMRRRTGK